jgi:hypothetical protein
MNDTTTTRTFKLPWSNADIDIHPDPVEGWHRVAVVGGWRSAAKIRKKWPKAAVVGPLRTVRGIDLLIRALLANPQIRVVVWDGPDLTAGEATKRALIDTWNGDKPVAADDLRECDALRWVLSTVLGEADPGVDLVDWITRMKLTTFRDHPYIPAILPPPIPEATTSAPHGDPGARIAGDTLADVWPRVLGEIMRSGLTIPTHYGDTRECRSLVTVIRDPVATVRDIRNSGEPESGQSDYTYNTKPHPVLGFTYAALEEYTERLTTAAKGEGAAYSYGSLLTGEKAYCERCWRLPDPESGCGACDKGYVQVTPDQVANLETGLKAKPMYRGHFLTPWIPSRFSDPGAKGKPCLVGIQFRATPGERQCQCGVLLKDAPETARACPTCSRVWPERLIQRAALHATVTFRSHDMFSAYPQNIAAVCLWLTRLAASNSMEVGTVLCHSVSAHIYDRDWAAAQDTVKAYKPPAVRWDQRSTWRVLKVGGAARVLPTQAGVGAPDLFGGFIDGADSDGDFICSACNRDNIDGYHHVECSVGVRAGGTQRQIRAEALTPDGTEVIAVFEAPTAGSLALKVTRSGLVTSIGAALWLGREIERVGGER